MTRSFAPRRAASALMLLATMLISACAPPPAGEPAPADESSIEGPTDPIAAVDAEAGDAQASNVVLRRVDSVGFEEVLTQHRGEVVFVDYWATWCGNCMEQFPHTVAMAEKYRGDGLAVVSVSMEAEPDDEETYQTALAFLESQRATFENLYHEEGFSDAAMQQLDVSILPFYRLYDRQGKLHAEFSFSDPTKTITEADIEQAVRDLLAEPAVAAQNDLPPRR